MSRYRLSPAAEDDLAAIGDFIARASGSAAADRVLDIILAALDRIADAPGIGRERPELTAKPVRVWQSFDYLIIYRRGEAFISVLRIWHGARAAWRLEEAIREADEEE